MNPHQSSILCTQPKGRSDDSLFLTPVFETIPSDLHLQPWAVWRAEPRDGCSNKFNKAPRCPRTGRKIGANQPKLFGSYADAKSAFEVGNYTGVGVLLTGTGIVGVDIDNYAETFSSRHEIKQWVMTAIKSGIYCERSPSGKGLRLFMFGRLPEGGRKTENLEVYDNLRFLTVTGRMIKQKETP
jgi:putative DNA primase/helicase